MVGKRGNSKKKEGFQEVLERWRKQVTEGKGCHTRRKAQERAAESKQESTFQIAEELLWSCAEASHHLKAFLECLFRKSMRKDLVGLQEQVSIH